MSFKGSSSFFLFSRRFEDELRPPVWMAIGRLVVVGAAGIFLGGIKRGAPGKGSSFETCGRRRMKTFVWGVRRRRLEAFLLRPLLGGLCLGAFVLGAFYLLAFYTLLFTTLLLYHANSLLRLPSSFTALLPPAIGFPARSCWASRRFLSWQ